MIRFGVTPEVNAVAAIVMAVSLVAVLLALRLTRPRGEQRMMIGPVG
jgi:ABC-type spermidine/putrescine transport system permease subunit II